MSNFSINEMLSMQCELQEKYKNKWETIGPDEGKHKLLWMIGEIGEVADVLMYNNDVLLCYGIKEDELKEAYIAKFEKNMKRW